MIRNQLSLVLPVRNGADYLGAALDSVLAQEMGDFTLFVSDNASDDATPAILADYAARDARIAVSRCPVPISQIENMNRSVALADTPWVRMLCHDDLMRPDCMGQTRAAIAAAADTRVGLIGNAERHLFANGHLTETRPDCPFEIMSGHTVLHQRFAGSLPAPLPAVTTAAFRRDALASIGGFDTRYVYFDTFAWYRLLADWDFGYIPAQLTVNRVHAAQVDLQARASLRTTDDFRRFMPEFLANEGRRIGLGARARLRAHLIAPGLAAAALVAELRAGRSRAALALLPRLPAAWLPLLPALMLRNWRAERRRLAPLEGKVPRDLLYPR